MRSYLDLLKEHNLLRVIDEPLDIHLEIPHIAYVEVKKPESKALLFTRPIDKKSGKEFETPVVMNLFGSDELVKILVGEVEEIAQSVGEFVQFKPPKGWAQTLAMLPKLARLRHVVPKKLKTKGLCQQVVKQGEEVDLYELPILTTWEKDGGPFITMGQVYTQDLEGRVQNLGMYRLQLYEKNRLGLHWQIHKDSTHFFNQYKAAGQKMPVSIAIGGDPLYTWCGTAPLPYGVFELLLYGFIRGRRAELVSCLTNPLFVPFDADFVIEGWVDTSKMRLEGPFGDHTGFYTPIEPYPELEVSAITHKKNPIYVATVVGKPPLEDKYLGYPTERIFLPLLKTTAPSLIDYYMPENGVFHNLILAKIAPSYPGHAKQIMHAFWGVGQMSFVKHALFVDEDAPSLREDEALMNHVLARFHPSRLLLSDGVCDALDHASPEYALGGKLGVDATGAALGFDPTFSLLSDEALLGRLRELLPEVARVRQIFTDTPSPIALVGVNKKDRSITKALSPLEELQNHLRIVVFVDEEKNDLENLYMILWRVVNNIDAKRDVRLFEKFVSVDATDKGAVDGHLREWPLETDCTKEVIQSLKARGLLEVDEEFERRFHLCGSPKTR